MDICKIFDTQFRFFCHIYVLINLNNVLILLRAHLSILLLLIIKIAICSTMVAFSYKQLCIFISFR